MRALPNLILSASAALFCVPSWAFDSFSQTGFTGLLRTPDASVIEQGDLWLNYSVEDGVDYSESGAGGNRGVGAHRTAIVGVGIVKGLEFTTQSTHKRIDGVEPGFQRGGGSDLSFSAKFSTKPFDRYPNFPVHFAAGFQDYSDNVATFHKNYYALAEYQLRSFQLIAGYGSGDKQNQMGADYLDGPFAGIEWQALKNLQLLADYDGTGVNAGVKYRHQGRFLPKGWSVTTNVQAFSTSDTQGRDNAYIGLELHVPLSPKTKVDWRSPITVGYSKTPKFAEQFVAGQRRVQSRQSLAQGVEVAPASYNDVFNGSRVAKSLEDYGFENIRIGYQYGKPVVAFENNVHNKNEIDGLGAALGMISEQWSSAFSLILLNNGVPVIGLDTRGDIVQVAIHEQRLPHWRDITVYERGVVKLYNSIDWDLKLNSARYKPRLQLSVNQRSSLGTEWGVIDYSAAIASNVTVDLWKGAVLDVRHFTPVAESDDADFPGHPVNPHENTIDRLLIHQAFNFDYGLTAQVSVGTVASDFDAIISEGRWQSTDGAHRVSLRSFYLEHQDIPDLTVDPVLLYYRYYLPGNHHGVEVFGGQFQGGDDGVGLRTLHWFGNTRVSLEFTEGDERYAGMYFEIPLMRNKSMKPHWGQITGITNWRWGYRTSIAELNTINPNALVESRLEHNLDNVYFNRDRMSPDYIYANLRFLMDAAFNVQQLD